jgi:hypothetical protein
MSYFPKIPVDCTGEEEVPIPVPQHPVDTVSGSSKTLPFDEVLKLTKG